MAQLIVPAKIRFVDEELQLPTLQPARYLEGEYHEERLLDVIPAAPVGHIRLEAHEHGVEADDAHDEELEGRAVGEGQVCL